MKKLFSKLRIISQGLSMAIIILVSVSCKSVEVVGRSEVQDVQKFRSVDTVVMRDSVYIKELQRGDTVYLTRIEYRDRWRTRIVHDTIHNTQYIEKNIEKPPEKYIPIFYKRCTIYFWCAIVLILLYIVLRLTKSSDRLLFCMY